MSDCPSRDAIPGDHTFGWDCFGPLPFAGRPEPVQEPAMASKAELPEDFDQRVRSIGEW